MNSAQGSGPDERDAHEAMIRAEAEARRKAAEDARLAKLASEFRLEEDSIPAVTVPDLNKAFAAPQAMYDDELSDFNRPICQAIENVDDLLPRPRWETGDRDCS
jgi:hypothetical protein